MEMIGCFVKHFPRKFHWRFLWKFAGKFAWRELVRLHDLHLRLRWLGELATFARPQPSQPPQPPQRTHQPRDLLLVAQRQLHPLPGSLALPGSPLPGSGSPAADLLERYPAGRTLFVCTGSGSAPLLELAVLRAVRHALVSPYTTQPIPGHP